MKRYRNEWKYCCENKDLYLLEHRLKDILSIDPHAGTSGKYYVHSLYFDDYKDTCCKDTEAGISTRFKWRIRYYENDTTNIRLEFKEKENGRCHKESCPLTREEYERIKVGAVSEIFWNTEFPLLKKFCIAIMTRQFTPKVIIDYERLAYIEPITNIRITLDTNISASFEIENFLTGKYQKYPIQLQQCQVLEVKFDDILPSHIKNILASYKFQQRSFSKYYLGRKRIEEVIK